MFVDTLSEFWKKDSQANFTALIHKYQHKILFFTGAHTHTADIRAPIGFNNTGLNMSIIFTPSVSPFHQNNPGYMIMDFNVTKTLLGAALSVHEKMTMRFFQLGEYMILKTENWITTDLETNFNFKVIEPLSIQRMVTHFKTDRSGYARYTVERLGFRQTLANLAGFGHAALDLFLARYKAKNYLCTMENYELAGYENCLAQ